MSSTTIVVAGTRQVPIEVASPAAQLSTGAYVVVTDSDLDARGWNSLAYTNTTITNSVYWKVFAANASDFTDEVEVLAEASVAAAASSSYAVSPPPYGYYRVKIKSNAGAGTVTIRGICKS